MTARTINLNGTDYTFFEVPILFTSTPTIDPKFCHFRLGETPLKDKKGLLLFEAQGNIVHVTQGNGKNGTLRKRINNGYGHISPAMPQKGGQKTHCRVNEATTKNQSTLKVWFWPNEDKTENNSLTKLFAAHFEPKWNAQYATH